MPSLNRRPRRRSQRRQPQNTNDMMMISSTRSTGAAEVSFPREDLVRRQGSWLLTQTPPRSISNQIHWVKGTNEKSTTISASVPTEFTINFNLSDFTNLAGLAGYFDQFCIYSATVNINFNYTGATPNALGTMITAIDYDNVTFLGAFSEYEAYESALTTKVTATQSVQRLIKPCVAPALYSGSAFTNYGISRMWVDSASPGTPHYGFRSYFISNTGTTLTATFDYHCVFGFRNTY